MLPKSLKFSIHLIVWLLFLFFPVFFFEDDGKDLLSQNFLFTMSLVVVFFYLNYFLLIPFLLLKKRLGLYVFALLMSLGLAYGIYYTMADHFILQFEQKKAEDMALGIDIPQPPEGRGPGPKGSMKSHMSGGAAFTVMVALLLSTIIRMTEEWYKSDEQKKAIAHEKLMSELSFLRSQVSPHFLFNTLNGIYSLALKQHPETADAILKLSGLMRHMLDEPEKNNTSVKYEIDYLRNYIELQKLRLSNQNQVSFVVNGEPGTMMIAPMLLIPFIENAFKHGVDGNGAEIQILIDISENFLKLSVNNRAVQSIVKDRSSGIGLENVRKRLELLYPGLYSLKIDNQNGYFNVLLKLKLEVL